ncbi:unnamed protein product, partial [Owenia fusiformis]
AHRITMSTIKDMKRKLEELGAELPPKNARKAVYEEYLIQANAEANANVDYHSDGEEGPVPQEENHTLTMLEGISHGMEKIQEALGNLDQRVGAQEAAASPLGLPSTHPMPQFHGGAPEVTATHTTTLSCPPPGGTH